MKKLFLGYVNIFIGAVILVADIWAFSGYVSQGSVTGFERGQLFYLVTFLIGVGSLTGGILALKGKGWIFSAISLFFGSLALIRLIITVLFVLSLRRY